MQIHGSMRPHRRPIRGHFSNLKTIAVQDMRNRFHREDRHRRDWHLRGYHPRHDWRADEQMEKLLCEKQRLERRLARMRRRLHFVNHQLYAQVG